MLLPGKSDNNISIVTDPSTGELCNPEDAPTIINNFFSTIGEDLDRKIPSSTYPLIRTPQVRLQLLPNIPYNAVLDTIKELKLSKPSGCVKISTKLYIAAFEALSDQLMFLFNLSIRSNHIPVAWKQGTITPIPKKGDRTILSNIRPIT